MRRVRFGLFLFVWILCLLPLNSSALIEEKSSVVGTLLAGPNNPMTGITVRLLDSFFLTEVAKTSTDKKGQFKLANVLPGLYLLSIETPIKPGILKRIQVVSGAPTFIDIRPYLTDEQLKDENAWERFKWTIRVGERNPLRDQEKTVMEAVGPDYNAEHFFSFLRNFQQANDIEAHVAYINYGIGPASESQNAQVTQFGVQGQIEHEGSWAVNGNFLQGSQDGHMAQGELRYQMFGHRIGANFSTNDVLFVANPVGSRSHWSAPLMAAPEILPLSPPASRWITSLDVNDSMQLLEKIRMNYGTRIDYYGYLSDAVSYSPRIGVSYPVSSTVAVRGLFYRNHSTPGNLYAQDGEDMHPYLQHLAFISYTSTLQPESTTGYETGLDYAARHLALSVFYYRQNVTNKIATVNLADPAASRGLGLMRPFLIFNARDVRSQGVQMDVNKRLTSIVSATASYTMEFADPIYIIEKRTDTENRMYFRNGFGTDLFHDVRAGVKADFNYTLTEVRADWKWSSGSPLIFGSRESNTSLSSIDIELHQGLPIQVFSETQVKLLLAVRNLLDQNGNVSTNADFRRALLYGMPRVVAGGVLLQF